MDDWIETLLSATLELSLPVLAIARGDTVLCRGAGRIQWDGESGLRVLADTDGADHLLPKFMAFGGACGRPLSAEDFVCVRAQTPDRWEVSTQRVPLGGWHLSVDSPHVTWDFTTSGLSLVRTRASEGGRRVLRAVLGPPPPAWLRWTETDVHNEYFGGKAGSRDWLLSMTQLGEVAARKHSEECFQVKILVEDAHYSVPPTRILYAVRDSFSFLLGQPVFVRGFEDILPDKEERYLDGREFRPTRNSLPPPLGSGSAYLLDHGEAFLARAIDFFMTDEGRKVAQHLSLCWDTADNQFFTRLAVVSICLESLVRLAADDSADPDVACVEKDRTALTGWVAENEAGLSASFVKRVRGFLDSLGHTRAKDVLLEWERQRFLGVTGDDVRAWEELRHRAAHGGLIGEAYDRGRLQTDYDRFCRVVNLINRIVLHRMGYQGQYVDYAQPGWPPTSLPAAGSAASGP